jgi:hypothetical protein
LRAIRAAPRNHKKACDAMTSWAAEKETVLRFIDDLMFMAMEKHEFSPFMF